MATTMRKTIANDDNQDNNDDNNVTMMTMILFFRQQPTLVGCISGREWVGDFYNGNNLEDDNNNDVDGHR